MLSLSDDCKLTLWSWAIAGSTLMFWGASGSTLMFGGVCGSTSICWAAGGPTLLVCDEDDSLISVSMLLAPVYSLKREWNKFFFQTKEHYDILLFVCFYLFFKRWNWWFIKMWLLEYPKYATKFKGWSLNSIFVFHTYWTIYRAVFFVLLHYFCWNANEWLSDFFSDGRRTEKLKENMHQNNSQSQQFLTHNLNRNNNNNNSNVRDATI